MRRGKTAKAKVDALKAELCDVQASLLKVGDLVRFNHYGKYQKIISIKDDTFNAGYITIELPGIGHGMPGTMKAHKFPTADQWKQIFELARKLKGCTVTEYETILK